MLCKKDKSENCKFQCGYLWSQVQALCDYEVAGEDGVLNCSVALAL